MPAARPEDVASPEAIVKALHESINGPQGEWSEDKLLSLCLPNTSFVYLEKDKQGKLNITSVTLDNFIQDVKKLHKRSAWYEAVDVLQVTKTEKEGGALGMVYYRSTA